MSSSAITGPVFTDNKRAPAGTAAAPSFAFNDSTGTGVYLVSAGVLGLSTAGVQRVVVDASGNVGIGTASPARKLHVTGAVNISDGNADRAVLSFSASGFSLNNNDNSAMIFATSNTERMRLDASGNLLVGTPSGTIGGKVEIGSTTNNQVGYGYYYNATTPTGSGFYVNSPQAGTATTSWQAFYFRAAGADRFFVRGDGVIFSTNTTVQAIASDVKLKENIIDYDKGLAEILKMKPRYFSWKAEPERREAGFIAQEMDEALPGSMIENNNGDKTYKMDWHPILVKAIQEQQEIISKLEARLAALESK